MRVLLTSAGLETEEIKDFFVKLTDKDMSLVRALFIPVAAIDADAVAVDALTPVAEQVGVFLELGIEAFVREVGTDQQVAVAEFAGRGLCLGRNDGVDAADLVAHLPAHFEQIVRGQFCVAHNLCFRL